MARSPYVLPAVKNFFAAAKLRRVRHLFFQSALGWANVSYIAFPARLLRKSDSQEDFASARIFFLFFFLSSPHFDIFFLFGFRLLAPKGKRVGRMQIWQTKVFSTSFTFYYPQFPYAPRATITNLFFFYFPAFHIVKTHKKCSPTQETHTYFFPDFLYLFPIFSRHRRPSFIPTHYQHTLSICLYPHARRAALWLIDIVASFFSRVET